jgi:flagellar basal-body rod protein FlgC
MSESILQIARSGMDVEYRRLEAVAANMANAGSAVGADGTSFVPVRLVSGPKASFAPASFAATLRSNAPTLGAQVYGYEAVPVKPKAVYEPGHPQADERGYVTHYGVDQLGEMTVMLRALRTYEANVAVFNATRSMYLKAIEIGGRQ